MSAKNADRSARDRDHFYQAQSGEEQDAGKQGQTLRFDDTDHSPERPQVETGIEQAKRQTHQTPQTPAKQSIFHAPAVKDLDPAADRLAEDATPLTTEDFYDLMGLNPPSSTKEGMGQLAKPHGLYSKIYRHLIYEHRRYRVFAVAVYVFLVLQLVISAIFIILGSLPHFDAHITIAILGAVSTVIAGALGLMQGQGLPNRLRQTRDALRDVIFAAEELYWDLRSGRPVLYRDVEKVREDYLRVLAEQRKNHPDAWNPISSNVTQGANRGTGGKK